MMNEADKPVPLCIDLDGTLIRSDLLAEGVLRLLRSRPTSAWLLAAWLLRGKAQLKAQIARHAPPPTTLPPVNEEVLEWIRTEKGKGRPIYLVTASHRDAVAPVLELFPFDGHFTSDDHLNLKGAAKAEFLVERFGERGFDYAGDSPADEEVWKQARRAIPVAHSQRRLAALEAKYDCDRTFCTNVTSWPDWTRALRLHQWSKNLLIALPFLAGHHFHTIWQLAGLTAAFLAMSLCASGTYLWNDLLDLDHDRTHPRKRKRLAASGRTSLPRILLTSTVLVGAGLSGATLLDPTFGLLLVGYIVVTLAYSLHFKRIAIADIFVLAFLYLSRVIAGILISEARVSFWLFGFTFLLFLSLAAAKRFVELQQTRERGDDDIAGRGYRAGDLGMVSALGVSTGVASCIVLALYSNSPQVSLLYARHEWIWGLCVIGLYWITRIWFLAHRGRMHDDPVVFALKDRSTWCLTLAGLLCVILAQPVPS